AVREFGGDKVIGGGRDEPLMLIGVEMQSEINVLERSVGAPVMDHIPRHGVFGRRSRPEDLHAQRAAADIFSETWWNRGSGGSFGSPQSGGASGLGWAKDRAINQGDDDPS